MAGSLTRANYSDITKGVIFAIIATLCWASNFILPYVTGEFSIYDLLLARFACAGLLGLLYIPRSLKYLRKMSSTQCLIGLGLGIVGAPAYGSFIAASITTGGPAVVAAFLGAVPVLQALLGNSGTTHISWNRLTTPMLLLAGGLLLVNLESLSSQGNAPSPILGIVFALGAVLCWLGYSFGNQRALVWLPRNSTGTWACLAGLGAGLGAVIVLPFLWGMELLKLNGSNLLTPSALHLYGWALFIALLCSIIGNIFWYEACRRLPMVLSGQLIAFESIFAVILGFSFLGRPPSLAEVIGVCIVVVSTVISLRIILPTTRSASRSTSLNER